MRVAQHHAEWLSLVETSGPFLSMPVLMRAFPQGLERRNTAKASRLREGYEDWLERGETQPAVHYAWIRQVLTEFLEYPQEFLGEGQTIPPGMEAAMANYGETLRPHFVLKHRDTDNKPVLLIQIYSSEQDLEKPVKGKTWKASPGTRMMELLHGADVPLGLITNGEQWTLVYAPRGETTGFASWYADLWMQEPITLRAFQSLLHLRRFIGVAESDTLESLLSESATDQQEVTQQLGYQVRRAVEMLVQAFAAIEAEPEGRTLFVGVSEKGLYNGALTVMMRLVFLFCAEERKLLLLGDPLYDQFYAVSTLSGILREQADQHGEEVLERRQDAWFRLLATFRAVHGGVEHETLRLPPYGGRLFDPDTYPFLEGRPQNTKWRNTSATPLPINNRVVLHLLEALQLLRVRVPGGGPTEARRLSFRALDVEQIGHVYEGLLDHTAKRARETVLGLIGTRDSQPEVPLSKLEDLAREGSGALVQFLKKETGKSVTTLKRLIERPGTFDEQELLIACGHDSRLLFRVAPFAALIREDDFGHFALIHPGSVFVTRGSDRRSTGTHYTPPSLTEPIVKHALEPLVYAGPSEGKPKEEWILKSPREILALKVCDMTMGSGAFLVQACRYLGERLVEAWEVAERANPAKILATPEGEFSDGNPSERLIPMDGAERIAIARRYVADRCLYGVDINPMAVEMAKLSLWLVTVQRERPFTFLDHAFKCGDALLGVSALSQIENFSLRSRELQATFATANLFRYVEEATKKRCELEDLPSDNYTDIETKNRLHVDAEAATAKLKAVADCLIALELRGLSGNAYDQQRTREADKVELLMKRDADAGIETTSRKSELARAADEQLLGRTTFHWPLEFPEVFARNGFDAFIGNPPYLGAPKLTGTFGDHYRDFLVAHLAHGVRGLADLCAYFVLRTESLLSQQSRRSVCGFVVTSAVAEGDTRTVGLQQLTERGTEIIRATSRAPWPGTASVTYSSIWLSPKRWHGIFWLNDEVVPGITPTLSMLQTVSGSPRRLKVNANKSFNGVKVYGEGFVLTPAEAQTLVERDARNKVVLFPYITTKDVNSHPTHEPSAWAIRFFDWPVDKESAPANYSGRVASDFPDCLAIVEERVKPERTRRDENGNFVVRDPMPQLWWIYGEKRPGLYTAISELKHVLAVGTQATKYVAFAILDKAMVFSHSLSIIADDSFECFAILHSSLHEVWAREYGGYNLALLRYSATDVFETFPFPTNDQNLETVGLQYFDHRRKAMLARREGLTDIYNRFHDQSEASEDIVQLRALQVEVDHAVTTAYGWANLNLGHGFHPTTQGERFTIKESARRQVLQLLLQLNHKRYAEELDAGLHTKTAKTKSRRRTKALDATRETQQAELPEIPAESL